MSVLFGWQVLDGMGISSEKLNIDMFDEVKVRSYPIIRSVCKIWNHDNTVYIAVMTRGVAFYIVAWGMPVFANLPSTTY